jgi:phospholipid transport system substrate-binding protein
MKPRNYTLSVYLIITMLLTGGLFQAASAQQDSATVRQLLEQRDDQIKSLLGPEGSEYTQQQRVQLKNIINSIVDYHSMARYALQSTYDSLTTEQREEFVDLFSNIVRDQSLNKLDIYRADVSYNSIEVTGDSALVNTIAQLKNVRTPVTYKMYYHDDKKQWFVSDMIIDDVSTAESYRRQFQNIIRKRGYDALLEILRKRATR